MHLDAKSIGWEREQCALEECCDVLTTLCEPLMSLRIPCQRRLRDCWQTAPRQRAHRLRCVSTRL